jgi:hypothetical protein
MMRRLARELTDPPTVAHEGALFRLATFVLEAKAADETAQAIRAEVTRAPALSGGVLL